MKIDEQKLAALHKNLTTGGSPEKPDIAKFLGVELDHITPYVDALKAKYPKIYGGEEKAAKTEPQPQITKVLLVDPVTGIGEQLAIKSQKDGRIVVEKIVPPEPKEEVIVRIAGKDVLVDLIKLRKLKPTDQFEGVTVQTLLVMGAIAKGE